MLSSLTADVLKVHGGKYVYCTCLSRPGEDTEPDEVLEDEETEDVG